jgi:hypothetical protein
LSIRLLSFIGPVAIGPITYRYWLFVYINFTKKQKNANVPKKGKRV